MGKRGSRSQSQLLGSLTKKQKKHLRDFGEEHPFYDRVSRKEAKPQTCQLSESSDTSSSESEAESEPEQVSGYHRLLATLKNVSKEEEEEEEAEEDSVMDETEMNLEDGDSDISEEEDMAAESTDMQSRVAILQRSIRLYAPFYSSDILIASPLGLRTIIGGEGEKKRDFDFLSSIELLIIDQADIYLMQNWEHVLHLMNHMNLLPLDSHGVDFSRVRMWSLNNWSKYYRQTLLFGALQDAQINSVFNKYCVNVQGQVAVRSVPMTGSISRVLVQLPHVFQRMQVESLASVIDARYTIKGIRNLIFYELPTYPHFYSEVCNMLRATSRGEEAAWTCTVLYSKYDAQRLAAVVGVERAAQMLQSKKNVHLFITGER